jgi:hypothetical protein
LAHDLPISFALAGYPVHLADSQFARFSLDGEFCFSAQPDKPGRDDHRRIAGTCVFGPLATTLHYLDDFFAERPQPMRVPDSSFFAELLALILCPFGLLIFAISLVLFIRSGRRTSFPSS